MHSINPQTFVEKFLQQLGENSAADHCWNESTAATWSDTEWTRAMTDVLVKTTREVVDPAITVCAKGHPDRDDRKEYLSLDVIAFDGRGWDPPLVIIEHENRKERIQYSAWKLLCVEAQLRVLVAYAPPKKLSSPCSLSRDRIRSLVEDVRIHHPQKGILLIAGEWRVESLRNVFELYPLGFGIHHSLLADLQVQGEITVAAMKN